MNTNTSSVTVQAPVSAEAMIVQVSEPPEGKAWIQESDGRISLTATSELDPFSRATMSSSTPVGDDGFCIHGDIPESAFNPAMDPAENCGVAAVIDDLSRSYKPFPLEELHPTLQAFVRNVMRTGVSDGYVVLPMLAAISGCIGNSRELCVDGDQWKETASLWVITVGSTGEGKSPGADPVTDILDQIQCRWSDAFRVEAEAYERLSKAQKRSEGIEGASTNPVSKPVEQRIVCEDATIEAIGKLLYDHPRGLILETPEASAFLMAFGEYKNGAAGGDRAKLTNLFKAKRIHIDRKTADQPHLYVYKPYLTVSTSCQPELLATIFARENADIGLAARFLLSAPPKMEFRRLSQVSDPDLLAAGNFKALLEGLLSLEGVTSHFNEHRKLPVRISMDSDALRLFDDFREQNHQMRESQTTQAKQALPKLDMYCAKIALNIYCIDEVLKRGVLGVVTRGQMEKAVKIATWFRDEMVRVYGRLAFQSLKKSRVPSLAVVQTTIAEKSKIVKEKLAEAPEGYLLITQIRRLCQDLSPDQVNAMLKVMEEEGVGRRSRAQTHKPGRPAEIFVSRERLEQL